MRLTYELLRRCKDLDTWEQIRFLQLHPRGCIPTVAMLFDLAAEVCDEPSHENTPYNVWALKYLLPPTGYGSIKDFDLRCLEEVAYLIPESFRDVALPLVRRALDPAGALTPGEQRTIEVLLSKTKKEHPGWVKECDVLVGTEQSLSRWCKGPDFDFTPERAAELQKQIIILSEMLRYAPQPTTT